MFPRLLRCCVLVCGPLLASTVAAQPPDQLPPPMERTAPPAETPPAAEALPAGPHAADDACCPPPVEKTYPVHQIHILEDQKLIELPRLPVREEITKVPFVGLDVEYQPEERVITFLQTRVRTEERIVNSVSVIPETTIDPCTGCPCTTYKEVPQCRPVTVEVVEVVPVTRKYTVQVPVLKPANKLALVRRVMVDQTTVPAVETRFRAVEAKSDITVQVPCAAPITVPSCPHGCKGH